MAKIPADIQVPTKEINLLQDSVGRLVEGINSVGEDMSKTFLVEDKTSLTASGVHRINRRLEGVSTQAVLFNNLLDKISANDIVQDVQRPQQQEEGFDISDIGDSIKDAMTSSFNKIKDTFENLFEKIKDAFENLGRILREIGEQIQEFIKDRIDEIKQGFQEFWSFVMPILEAMWGFIQWCWEFTKSLAEFMVWFTYTFTVNTYKALLITPLLFCIIYYGSKALVIYLTGTPDEVLGALLLATSVHVWAVTYQIDALLDIQDMFIEIIMYLFLNPLARWALNIKTTDRVYQEFSTYVSSPVVSSRKKMMYSIFNQILDLMKEKQTNTFFYLLFSTVIGKFLLVDVPLQSFRLTMKDITGFGTIIQV